MKNVLMIIILMSGFALNMNAQACKPADCVPCPPGCCIINCCTSKSAASASTVNADGKIDVFYASMSAVGEEKKMTKKEMKNCLAACKAEKACKPSPACQVAPSCNTVNSQSAEALYHPVVQQLKK